MVVFNGQTPSRPIITTGVPQGFILVILRFLIYINDLPDG